MPEPDREAYAAAERLVREAHARAEEAVRAAEAQAPPNGWATPGSSGGRPQPDFNALFALIESAKGTLPPELLRQLTDALRELLIALRAALDYSIEKLERPVPESRDVEDIPIS
jgi:hypothetical protein